ncbi:response regulator [Verrucomicrobiota bacterium]
MARDSEKYHNLNNPVIVQDFRYTDQKKHPMTKQKDNTFNILIIDDEQNVISGFQRLLHRLSPIPPKTSYRIFSASQGNDAMSIINSKEIGCILLDYNMPGGDGLVWLKRILELKPNTAIVMVTGEGNEKIAVEAMKNGAMDYLVKGSVTIEDLERAIINAAEKVKMRNAIEQQRNELLEAERHRVMIASLGAACHHLGQPITVISTYIAILKKNEKSPEKLQMIEEFSAAAEAMSDVLDKLRKITQYRTVPYRPSGESEPERIDEYILDVEGENHARTK